MSEFKYKINKEEIIDESLNRVTKISWIHWGNSEEEKIDIRNWRVINDNDILAGKGISLNAEKANTLTNILIKNGLGDLEVMAEEIKNRTGIDVNLPEDVLNDNDSVGLNCDAKYINPQDIIDM